MADIGVLMFLTEKSLIATAKDTLSYRFDFQDKDFDKDVRDEFE